MLPPPQGRPPHAELSSAGLLLLVLVALAAGCGGGDGLAPQPQRTFTLKAGDGQEAFAGSVVPIAPSVAVTDAGANPVAGVAVTFQVTAGGGSVSPATAINTDAQGTATVASWTLGTAPGSNTLSASAAGVTGSPVVFTATGLAGATIRGTITVSGDVLSARATGPHRGSRAFPASTSQPALRRRAHTSNELIVRFRPGAIGAPAPRASALASRSTAARVRGEIHARMAPHLLARAVTLTGITPTISAARIQVRDPADLAMVASRLRMDPAVATVERNSVLRSVSAGTPTAGLNLGMPPTRSNDPRSAGQAWHYGMIDLPEAWSITTGSASVLVAVIDDGIRFDHPDLTANLSTDGYDFVSNPSDLQICSGGTLEPSGDGDGYDADPTIPTSYGFDAFLGCITEPLSLGALGVSAAGIIGAVGNNAVGIAGINWSVRIRPVRVLGINGLGTGYDVAQGILYAAGLPADDGAGGAVQAPSAARIISMSLSAPEDDAVVRDAVAAASGAGALVVVPAGLTGGSAPEYPAAYPEALAVSALAADGQLTFYSSFGSTVDIAAPGGDFPDGSGSFGALTTVWDFVAGEPEYAFWRFGPPVAHVAGVAALLLAQEPGLTATELRSRLTDYAVDAGTPGRDDQYGAGIVNARNSLAKNSGPSRQLHARLYDALTGSIVQTAAVAVDGSYSFTASAGAYRIFAGQDESGDALIGLPGRRWGAFGGSATPSSIDVSVGGTHHASFAVGFPSEHEPNETISDASALPVGGYLSGIVSAPAGGDTDVFKVQIAQAGQYTFETSGVDGACGFALEENTTLGLHGQDDSAIEFSDDMDADALNFCSRITRTLQPGTYYLRVQGLRGGRYRVQARSGP
jgi:subtilisin family serine protease